MTFAEIIIIAGWVVTAISTIIVGKYFRNLGIPKKDPDPPIISAQEIKDMMRSQEELDFLRAMSSKKPKKEEDEGDL